MFPICSLTVSNRFSVPNYFLSVFKMFCYLTVPCKKALSTYFTYVHDCTIQYNCLKLDKPVDLKIY